MGVEYPANVLVFVTPRGMMGDGWILIARRAGVSEICRVLTSCALIADDVMKEEEIGWREVVSEISAGSWRRWRLV